MNQLTVTGLHKAFHRVKALNGASLTIEPGTLTAVLGPSGCGKTTLLRCVAGFDRPDHGEIRSGERLLAGPGTHVAPHQRRIAVVPQEGALFPHLSVAANVAYGLGRSARRSGRVDEVLALVGLTGLGSRQPHQLSGGQQQRVAVARALAPKPALVLLDEPFSALDAALRVQLRQEIRDALAADGSTAILVTHDQDEALSIAGQVALMRDGQIVQTGSPEELYQRPADPWAASFIGEANLIPGTANGTTADSALGPITLAEPIPAGRAVTVLVRPEQIQLRPASGDSIPATVRAHQFHGHDSLITVESHTGTILTIRVPGSPGPGAEAGHRVHVGIAGAAWAWTR
jgi:iron(III) transport system ATP-binding protein